jgi:hypothetical protein
VLRHCLPASIRQTLDQLPESLDDTYLRVLGQIPQSNQAHAHRMLQCLVVAVRPLRVEELAEMLAFKFDAAQEGIPKYQAALRLDDQTTAVLSTCSSLVTIVNDQYWPYRQVVQFSHFSVKEFLMSTRLGDFSQYHILPLSAHTVLTQACLGFLLHLDDKGDKKSVDGLPLAKYAAQNWVKHGRFPGVAPRVKAGIETLFDSDKPHFAAWLRVYNMVNPYETHRWIPNPLYYAVRCGFYDLVKHLATKHPQHVNVRDQTLRSPLHLAEYAGELEVAQILVEHEADVNCQDKNGKTPLHILSEHRMYDEDAILSHARLLLELGAELDRRDKDNQTPLFRAIERDWFKFARILLDFGADANVENNNGKTLLDLPFESWSHELDVLEPIRHLLEHGAAVNRPDKNNQTPLLHAIRRNWWKPVQILLEHGADTTTENSDYETPVLLEMGTEMYKFACNLLGLH